MRRKFGRADHLQAAAALFETAVLLIKKGDEVNAITLARQGISNLKQARKGRLFGLQVPSANDATQQGGHALSPKQGASL